MTVLYDHFIPNASFNGLFFLFRNAQQDELHKCPVLREGFPFQLFTLKVSLVTPSGKD